MVEDNNDIVSECYTYRRGLRAIYKYRCYATDPDFRKPLGNDWAVGETKVVPYTETGLIYNTVELVECIPYKDMKLYKLGGRYLGKIGERMVSRYFLAPCLKDARKQYEDLFGWKAIRAEEIRRKGDKEAVFTDKYKMPI